jgi:DNA mismatch endonuclease (patch repair protein)
MVTRRPLSRSEQMSRIKGQNTKPEMILRSALWSAGLRYRVQGETPSGKPDITFPTKKVAVFMDGCFWHGCPLHYVRPCSHSERWAAKLRLNVERDRRQTLALEAQGWKVIRLWEHEVYEALSAIVKLIELAAKGMEPAYSLDWRVIAVEKVEEGSLIERRHYQQLRDPEATRVEEGRRITAKWRRPCRRL